MTKLPSSLIVALWLTGGAWLLALGHIYWHLPPVVLVVTGLMVAAAAAREWLSGGEPPR